MFNMSYNYDNIDIILINMLEEQLKDLGLSDYESRIYNILISHSPASATLIAKKCNLSRSSVYTTLSSLIAKGLVGVTYKNDVKQFVAGSFDSLKSLIKADEEKLKKKIEILDQAEKTIKALSGQKLNVPNIIFFEGQEGLKKIYLSMMRQSGSNSTMYILRDEFVWQSEWKFVFDNDWHNRVKRLKTEKNIKTVLLINDSKIERSKTDFYKSKKNLDFHFLPKNKAIKQFAIYITEDIVSILSIENNNLVGIKITNDHIAQNFQKLFDVLISKNK